MLNVQTSSIKDVVKKEDHLKEVLTTLRSVVIGFSGGVDSAYLAYVANQVLGKKALCVTAISPSYPSFQRIETAEFVTRYSLHHLEVETSEIENPRYRENSSNRCYYCKSELFAKLQDLARIRGYDVVVDGTNYDDRKDFRPGRKAAKEYSVQSPLFEVQMTKLEIRELSRRSGLPTWDKPALPCLSSRFPYGTSISPEKLSVVDRGEEILRDFGFKVFRVRYHESLVRLEFSPKELPKALNVTMSAILNKRFKSLGFKFVTVDLEGYRSGSLNEVLPLHPSQD
ncbi:MAG: ATP-dependent sacrificial sulfur transferase LarE [Acidobacteriia bacterium]|nr:ATP-dependent sacrificial sulfur transferase LarE [Terriglobia bacterium]